jgi:nucleotide-binding universal stress UspA family protein
MNAVFVPTDFARSSGGGITLGAAIARSTNSALTIHHNVRTLSDWQFQDRDQQFEHPEILGATVEAERLMARLMKDAVPDSLVVNKLITHGITASEIVSNAEKVGAGIIVMGSHGVEDAGRTFIGSTVQKVIRSANLPVILAKQNTSPRVPGKIVFPCKFNEDVQRPFSEIQRWAAQFGATIHLLFVNTPAHFMDSGSIRAKMEEFAAIYTDQDFVMDVYSHTDVVTAILAHSRNIQADMIAMVSHDRLHQPQYLIGITESVAFHSEVPVLSVNARVGHHEHPARQGKTIISEVK